MASSKELIECFQDTVNKCYSSKLYELTEKARKSTVVFDEKYYVSGTRICKSGYVEVIEGTSFAVAKRYINKGGKVCVLNFANPHYAGGGVANGAMAQEECLCRSSNLYQCLTTKVAQEYYYDYNIKHTDYFFSDKIIYSDKVTVFKDDSVVPVMMPEEDWFNVSVITCAAPYMAKCSNIDYGNLKEVFKKRIKNIFEVAFDNHVDILILGAFGCGAFKNPPRLVAEAFEEVIREYRGYFDNFVFVIKKTSDNCPNYNAFKDVFASYEKESKLQKISQMKDNSFVNSDYFEKINNKVSTKKISILGDSISTLKGVNPQGYKVFFTEENCARAGIKSKEDTWWGQVIDYFGGELLVNNSWSGSRVTKLPDSDTDFPSACSDERTSGLHFDKYMPDEIIVFLGVNDWCFGAKQGDVIDDKEYFETAYRYMLSRLKYNYPKARIWCCTICSTYMSCNSSFVFPEVFQGNDINYYNGVITKVATQMDVNVVDLYSYHIPYDTIDGTHPNKNGMSTIAQLVIKEMLKQNV